MSNGTKFQKNLCDGKGATSLPSISKYVNGDCNHTCPRPMSSMAGCWSQRLACSNLPVTVADGRWIPDLSTLQCSALVQLLMSLSCDWFEWCAKSKVYLSTATAIVWEISLSLSPMLFAKATAPGLKLRFKWIFNDERITKNNQVGYEKDKNYPFWRVKCTLFLVRWSAFLPGKPPCSPCRRPVFASGHHPWAETFPQSSWPPPKSDPKQQIWSLNHSLCFFVNDNNQYGWPSFTVVYEATEVVDVGKRQNKDFPPT